MYNDFGKTLRDMIGLSGTFSEDGDIFTTEGKRFEFTHHQSCCELVSLYSTIGKPAELNHQVISGTEWDVIETEEVEKLLGHSVKQPYGSYTWTLITIYSEFNCFSMIWLGESNGYYSESVDLDVTAI